MANGRKNYNSILALQQDNGTAVPDDQLAQTLYQHFKSLLGLGNCRQQPFSLTGKVGPKISDQLQILDNAIGEEEIKQAIHQMLPDKSSGPDGLTIEFYRAFWTIIKEDFVNMVKFFYDNSHGISSFNQVAITLIPKKEAPVRISDYRPISVINTVVKIITKVMANRLQPHLKQLVGINQTAFV